MFFDSYARIGLLVTAVAFVTTLTACGGNKTVKPDTTAEITALMNVLTESECEFFRNGTWYESAEAREHLERKYNYLRERDLVATTEDFIELAGSQSSISGRAYKVRCPGEEEQKSADWLRENLAELRGG